MQIDILYIAQRAKRPHFTVSTHAYDRGRVTQDIFDRLDLAKGMAPQDLMPGQGFKDKYQFSLPVA